MLQYKYLTLKAHDIFKIMKKELKELEKYDIEYLSFVNIKFIIQFEAYYSNIKNQQLANLKNKEIPLIQFKKLDNNFTTSRKVCLKSNINKLNDTLSSDRLNTQLKRILIKISLNIEIIFSYGKPQFH